jgi:outer membrane protein TolC
MPNSKDTLFSQGLNHPHFKRRWSSLIIILNVVLGSHNSANAAAPTASEKPAEWKIIKRRLEELNQQWIELKQDLIGDTSQTITLEQAIQLGVRNNPGLSYSFTQLENAKWTGAAIRREWNPLLVIDNPNPNAIGYTLDNKKTTSSKNGTETRSEEDKNQYGLSPRLQLSWTFFDPTRAPRSKANDAEVQFRRNLFDASARNIILDIQHSYFELQTDIRLLKEYEDVYQNTQQTIRSAVGRLQQGRCAQKEINQLRTQQFKQLTQIIQQNEQTSKSAYQLAFTMNLEPGSLIFPSGPLQSQGTWPLGLKQSISEALQSREEILALLDSAARQKWLSRSLLNKYLPLVSVLAQSFYQSDNFSKEGTPTSPAETGITQGFKNQLGFNLKWKLYDGGIDMAKANAATQDELGFLQKAQLERLSVTQQVQKSYAAYRTSLLEQRTTQQAVQEAFSVFKANNESFSCKPGETTTLVQNIQSLLSSILSNYQSTKKHNVAISSLYRYTATWPGGTETLVNPENHQINSHTTTGQLVETPTKP